METTQRVTIRQTSRGYTISSKNGGVFGTKIGVRHYATALGIKSILKRIEFSETRSAMIDAMLRDEPKAGYPLVPVSRLHLVVGR